MEYGKTLIDKAGKVCGSFYKLHKETGFSQATISEVRNNKRALPLEWVPVLAEIAQVDPQEAVAHCLCERLPEGSRAQKILGGASATGAVAMLLFSVVLALGLPSTSYAKTKNAVSDASQDVNILYIVEYIAILLDRLLSYVFSKTRSTGFLRKPTENAMGVQRGTAGFSWHG